MQTKRFCCRNEIGVFRKTTIAHPLSDELAMPITRIIWNPPFPQRSIFIYGHLEPAAGVKLDSLDPTLKL